MPRFVSPLHVLGSTLCAIVLCASASATLTVKVISPVIGEIGSATGGSPVFYEAYATSPECAYGISAMRIYTGPGVDAYTAPGDHLETFIALPTGNYNTYVQAWDNCGAVAKVLIPLQVESAAITVYLPESPSQAGYNPVHIAASAQSSCSKGISAMRLYTAPYLSPYTIGSNSLDTHVSLPPATYDMTVVAWDNCGGTFTSNFSVSVTGAPDGYVYGIWGSGGALATLQVGGTGNLFIPNGAGTPPTVSVPGVNSAVVDPGGWFLYASGTKGIYAYEIYPSTGTLSPVAGSPISASGVNKLVMDPSGDYLYAFSSSIATYRINRSSGALTATGPSINIAAQNYSVATFQDFMYLISIYPTGMIWGFTLDYTTGFLYAIPGTPFGVNSGINSVAAQGYRVFVNDDANYGGGFNGVYVYNINPSSGSLTQAPGSPYGMEYDNIGFNFVNMWGDWENRYLWEWQLDTTDNNNEVYPLIVNSSNGSLTLPNVWTLGGPPAFANFTEDLTGDYIFTQWNDAIENPSAPEPPNDVGVQSYFISSDGQLVGNSSTILGATFGIQAVSRQDPD